MNLGQIRGAVRELLIETTPGFWTNQELNDYINDGYMELVPYARILKIPSVSFTTVAGQQEYLLPTDLHSLLSVSIDRKMLIPMAQLSAWEEGNYTGKPTTYSVFSEKNLILEPTPDNTYDVMLSYFVVPPRLSVDTDVPMLPLHWVHILKYFAVAQAKRKDDDPIFMGFQNDWERAKEQFILDRRSIQQQNFNVIASPWGV